MKKKIDGRKPAARVGHAKSSVPARTLVSEASRSDGRRGAASAVQDSGREGGGDFDKIISEVSGTTERGLWNHWTQVQCPYCGEDFDVHFDMVEDGHTVNEDCAVCCKPIVLSVSVEDEDIQVSAYRA